MAHHAVPALIHTHAVRPSAVATRSRQQQRSTSEASTLTDSDSTPKSMKLSQRSLWCCFFLIMPFAIPILIYVKDSDLTRRIFLGVFIAVVIIILVCFSLAVFHNGTRLAIASREGNDDGGGLRRVGLISDRHFLSATQRLLSPRTTIAFSPADPSLRRGPYPGRGMLTVPSGSTARAPSPSGCLSSDPSPADSMDDLPPYTLDDPPPYHVALSLPLPEIRSPPPPEAVETPPPSYDKVLG